MGKKMILNFKMAIELKERMNNGILAYSNPSDQQLRRRAVTELGARSGNDQVTVD